jgi:hypothetical protein
MTPHEPARFSSMGGALVAYVLIAATGWSGSHDAAAPPPPDPATILDDATCPANAQTIAQIDDPGATLGTMKIGTVAIGAVAVADDGSVYFVQRRFDGTDNVLEIYVVAPGGAPQRIAKVPGNAGLDSQIWIEGETLTYLTLGSLYTLTTATASRSPAACST